MLQIFASISAALSVILGAFGAHILAKTLSNSLLTTFETATSYMLLHSISILIIYLLNKTKTIQTLLPGYLFAIGIVLFSGSLLLYIATKLKVLMIITPFGGLSFILGWLSLAWICITNKNDL